jgi:hypothetical protein
VEQVLSCDHGEWSGLELPPAGLFLAPGSPSRPILWSAPTTLAFSSRSHWGIRLLA